MGKIKRNVPLCSDTNPSYLWVWTGEIQIATERPLLTVVACANESGALGLGANHYANLEYIEKGVIRMANRETIRKYSKWALNFEHNKL